MRWYSVVTYSGEEEFVKDQILRRAQFEKMRDFIEDIVIAKMVEEKVIGGKRTKKEKVRFPGYLFIHAQLSPDLRVLIEETPRVRGFVGGVYPTEVPESDLENIKQGGNFTVEEQIGLGAKVKVMNGPFSGFTGMVSRSEPGKANLTVRVEIFGRSTPVEISKKDVTIDQGGGS